MSNIKRTIGPNYLEDDPVMRSYLAMAYCIAGVKVENKRYYLSPDKLATVFLTKERLDEDKVNVDKKIQVTEKVKGTRNKCGAKNKKCKGINIMTGEEVIFKSHNEAGAYINREANYIGILIKNKRVTKDGWKMIELK